MWPWLKSRRLWIAIAAVLVVIVAFRIGVRWFTRSILPSILRTQLTAALEREVEFSSVDTDLFSYFAVKDLVVAKGDSREAGSAVTVGKVVIKYRLIRLFLYPKAWTKAIRRIEVISPHFEVAMEEVFPERKRKRAAAAEEATAASLPPLPKTFMRVEDGRIVLTRRGRPVLEVRRFGGNLDLRDLPRIEGSVKFIIAPEAALTAEGYCHLGLRSFKGGISIDGLDFGQFSDLARLADPSLAVRVGGRLRAELEVQGGFMTLDELVGKTVGTGSLRLDDGSVAVHGSPVVTDMSASGALDGRRISLDRLEARVLSGRLDAAGRMANLGLGEVRMQGELKEVPVEALQVISPGFPEDLEGTLSFAFSATGTGRVPLFYGRLSSPRLGIPGLLAEDVIAEAEYSISSLELTNVRARLWEGTFEGDGSLRGLNAPVQEVDFSLEGKGFNVALSPLGKDDRFSGRADLSVKLAGPTSGPTGDLHARFTEVKAKSVPMSDIAASAHFEKGRVSVQAQTAKRTVVVSGDVVLGPDVLCEGCQADVQEQLPVILALSGVTPPEGFRGRVSARILLEGRIADPKVTVDAFASGVRFGKVVVGDQIRVPRFVYRAMTLEVPETHPMEVRWIPQETHVTAYGKVPVGAFSREGVAPVAFHLECLKGRMDVLERLSVLRKAEGGLTVVLDVGGTAAYPVWSCTLAGAGRTIDLASHVFSEPISRWDIDARMLNNEGIVKAGLTVAKQAQRLDGGFSMGGWKLGHLDLRTWTAAVSGDEDDLKGLPLDIPNVAKIYLKLNGRVVKETDSEAVLITGRETEQPAELNLSRGVIMYAGGEGAKKKEDAGPDPVAEWAKRSLDIQGRISFGEAVVYRPRTLSEKAVDDALKAVRSGGEARMEVIKQYLSFGGLTGLMRDLSVGFDVGIVEGSALEIAKRGGAMAAKGEIGLEEGGEVALAGKKFIVGGGAGSRNYIEFKPGDQLSGYVNITSETTLFNKYLLTNTGERVHMDRLRIRMVLSPPSADELDEWGRSRKEQFLIFKYELVAEPPRVIGEVESAGAGEGQPSRRTVSFRPTSGALFAALTGQEDLAGAAQESAGTAAGSTIGGKIVGVPLGLAVKLLRLPLGLIGADVSVGKSEMARQRDETSASSRSAAGTNGAAGGMEDFMAGALDNTEVTIEYRIAKNLYANWRTILLDSSRLMRRTSTGLGSEMSNPIGNIAELSYRTSSYKGTIRTRFFEMPDDTDLDARPREYYLGGQVNRMFHGVGQKDDFVW